MIDASELIRPARTPAGLTCAVTRSFSRWAIPSVPYGAGRVREQPFTAE